MQRKLPKHLKLQMQKKFLKSMVKVARIEKKLSKLGNTNNINPEYSTNTEDNDLLHRI